MASPPDFSRRIPQLDGLRGIAVLMVVVYHYVNDAFDAGAPRFTNLLLRPVNLGWTGVDLFFVLSGFLIGGILLDARESSNYFRVFYRRRVCRIFPMYFAFLTVVLLAVHFFRLPFAGIFAPEIPRITLATFTQNFWMALHNRFGEGALAQTWSLAVEEQFYLTLPAVIYFARPERLPYILGGGIILAPLLRLSLILKSSQFAMACFVLLPCRMDSLLFGVALAYLVRQPRVWNYLCAHRRAIWTAVEVLTIICGVFLFSPAPTVTAIILIGYDCFSLLYTCLIALALMDETMAAGLRTKWLMGLGTISYCVYLIHVPVFGFVLAAVKNHSNAGAIAAFVAFAVTLIVAKLSWISFERPFVNLGHREVYERHSERQDIELQVS